MESESLPCTPLLGVYHAHLFWAFTIGGDTRHQQVCCVSVYPTFGIALQTPYCSFCYAMPNNRVNFFMYGSSPSRSSSATTGIPSRSSQPGLGVSSSTFHPHTQVSPVGTTSPLSSGEISSRANKENPPSSMPGHFPEPEIVFVSLSTTCSEEHSNDAKELLEQLNSLKIVRLIPIERSC